MGKPRPQPRCANAGEFDRGVITPNQLRWRPFAIPSDSVDFVRGLTTVCGAGSAGKKDGFAIHVYTASISMDNCCLANADGDMLIVPQQGEAHIACCLTFVTSIQHTHASDTIKPEVLFIILILVILNSRPHQILSASYSSSCLCQRCKHVQQPRQYRYTTYGKCWCSKLAQCSLAYGSY